ncbi:MAG: S41 family peptidase [Tenuifilaceae bacterium]|nr:S41 family peptidase [Tenuifilaceae bacterium]
MNTRVTLIAILFAALCVTSCKKDDPEVDQNILANEQLVLVMDDYYLWYEKLPSVDYKNYPSPVELLDALVYKELDRWSYISTKQEIDAYYNQGEFQGYGIGMGFDRDDNLWITFVFKDSPLAAYGVDRGWRISKINNSVVTPSNANSLLALASATFTLIDPDGTEVVANVAKREVVMNTVLMDSIYETSIGKVGYFVLKGFIGPTIDELDEVFDDFLTQGVSELIVDLRYNGGGSVQTAVHLANLIAGATANNQVLGRYVHNDKQSDRNENILMSQKANSLDLSRVVFITTGNSASASELVINGLFPHMEVTLVGQDTYGKPVGMYIFTSESFDWAFVPICFKILNANNEGDYYDGIPVDILANDGVSYPFGDLGEASLAAAIAFITGEASKQSYSAASQMVYPKQNGIRSEIGAW